MKAKQRKELRRAAAAIERQSIYDDLTIEQKLKLAYTRHTGRDESREIKRLKAKQHA